MSSKILALPIVFLRDKSMELTHQEALYSAAMHMYNVVTQHHQLGAEWEEAYDSWDRGQFRKIVRRSTPQKFRSLSVSPEALNTSIILSNDRIVELLSLPPRDVEDRDDRLKSMQVSGFQLPLGDDIFRGDEGFFIAVNSDLNASTGKLMAQVSHIVQITLKSERMLEALDKMKKGIAIYSSFASIPSNSQSIFEVRDAGFTEIPPNSLTAVGGFIS